MLKNKLIKIVILAIVLITVSASTSLGYWSNNVLNTDLGSNNSVNIGVWDQFPSEPTYPIFDINKTYEVGDRFIYNGTTFEVIGGWFDAKQFIVSGKINTNYLKPYGTIKEVTDEYRSYNTYKTGDSVIYLGETWIVRHEGANSTSPGSDTNAWNVIREEYYSYNTYETGDIVIYQGQRYRAKTSTRNNLPTTNWAWELVN